MGEVNLNRKARRMDNENIILSMLKEIKDDIKEIKKDFKEHKGACEGRFRCLEDFKTKVEVVKSDVKDRLSFWALLVACVSGILTIVVNADKVFGGLK